jgi:hypothetical protein
VVLDGDVLYLDRNGNGDLTDPGKRIAAQEVKRNRDDPASTLVVVEAMKSQINWMEPRDLEWDRMSFRLNDHSRPSISSEHHYGSYSGPVLPV